MDLPVVVNIASGTLNDDWSLFNILERCTGGSGTEVGGFDGIVGMGDDCSGTKCSDAIWAQITHTQDKADLSDSDKA